MSEAVEAPDQPDREVAVSVRDLDVYRGGTRVLPAISVEVRREVVTGLLGPSGSGKTTLMRAIVGVQIVRGGQVTVLGEPAGTPALRRSVAYVTQAPSVYGDLTVRENLHYFARVLGASPERIGETIERIGLPGQARQFMPVFILPQFLLAGLFIPRERMPDVLARIADFLPFTYAYEALAKVAADDIDGRLWLDVGVVTGSSVLALTLGALTLRRRTP